MEKIYKLTKGDNLAIDNKPYTVKGVLELKQANFRWKEFLLTDTTGQETWLNVEPATQELILYRETTQQDRRLMEEREHTVFETGKGTVILANNIQGISRGNTVEFADYVFTENERERWSYEKWKEEEFYFIGKKISLSSITLLSNREKILSPTKDTSKRTLKDWRSLSLGQKLRLRGTEYYISGIADYKQHQFQWTEYKLEAGTETLWLSVEGSTPGKVDFSIFRIIPRRDVAFSQNYKKATYQDTVYDCVDAGNGRVIRSSGKVDFDPNEPFSFRDYEAKDGRLLSFEKWEDETETSVGETLQEFEIEILQGKKKKLTNIKASNVIWAICGIAISMVFIIPWISSLFALPIQDTIKKNSRFSYVTSITATGNSKNKSHIYETSFSPDQTCQYIIKIDPENTECVITPNEKGAEEIFLQTNKETVLIYISEDNTTYVQLSKKETDEENTPYRARSYHRVAGFYTSGMRWSTIPTEGEKLNTSKYNSFLHQARQESINARRARGGGTSFGK